MNRRFSFIPLSLRNQAGDPAGGGGGSGEGAPPAPLTIEAILAAIGPVIESKLGALRTSLNNDTNAAISKRLKGVEDLERKVTELASKPEGEAPGGKSKVEAADPQIEALRRELADVKERHAQSEKLRAATEQKAREESTAAKLTQGLTDIRPELQAAAKALLVSQGITYGEDGTALLTVTRKDSLGIPETVQLPIPDALNVWKKSDEAKVFLPAPAPAKTPAAGASPPRAGFQPPPPQTDPNAPFDSQAALARAAARTAAAREALGTE
jgi:hypothetical protein